MGIIMNFQLQLPRFGQCGILQLLLQIFNGIFQALDELNFYDIYYRFFMEITSYITDYENFDINLLLNQTN